MSLSIVTAIHNGLPMNRLYWKALCQNTTSPFELILIDNHSTDGSEEFFQQIALSPPDPDRRLVYVRNEKNRNYPLSQMQGMDLAKNPILVFLNNDTWMPRGWEVPLVAAATAEPFGVFSPSGQEAQPTQKGSETLKRRWRRLLWLSRVWGAFPGRTEEQRLWKALRWMYGDLDHFRSPTTASGAMNGIKGDCVVFHRRLLEKIPNPWNPQVEASDWHLYLLAASLHELSPEIPLPQIVLDSYVHHFGRYSGRQKFEPQERPAEQQSIDQYWGPNTVRRLWWGFQLPIG